MGAGLSHRAPCRKMKSKNMRQGKTAANSAADASKQCCTARHSKTQIPDAQGSAAISTKCTTLKEAGIKSIRPKPPRIATMSTASIRGSQSTGVRNDCRGWAGQPDVRGPRVPSPRVRLPLCRLQAISQSVTAPRFSEALLGAFRESRLSEMALKFEGVKFCDEGNNSFLRRFF